MEINILPFLCEAFSINKRIYKDVDKIYNADKIKFIEAAKKDIYYNHLVAQEGNIEQEYYFKKSLGIFNVAKEDIEVADEVINICKKGWRYAYNYIEQNNTIRLSLFLDRLIRKVKGLDHITDDELNSNIIIVLFLAQQLEKNMDTTDKLYITATENYILRIEHYEKRNRININNISKEEFKKLKSLELKIKNENKIGTIPSSYRFDSSKYEGLVVNINKLTKDDKFFGAFEYIFDLENISLISIVAENYLKSKDIQELIYCYTQFQNEEEFTYDELKKFLYPAIQIRYLCREYKKAKEFFFKNFNEELYEEISQVECENRETKKSNLLLQDENEKLKLEIEELKRENKRLKQELEEGENTKEELNKLREFIFNLEDLEDYKEDEEIDYNKLKKLNAVIIGGHQQWQSKMKEYLPTCKFISPEALNFDVSILSNVDKVFIYTNYLNHGMYYKVINEVRQKGLNIKYLKANTNEKIILNQIIKAVD